MIEATREHFRRRSVGILAVLDTRFDAILRYWLLGAGLVAVSRINFFNAQVPVASGSTFLSYSLLVFAPFASALLAMRWFHQASHQPQPQFRLSRIGRWTSVELAKAEQHELYGAGGIMVSLLVGMLLNVPVRAAEYLMAMPPMPVAAPAWLSALHFIMTLDVVLFGSLYAIAFVAALRRAPLFPRLLLAIWLGDLLMQMTTAKMVVAAGPIPPAVSGALHVLLEGNIKKTLISMAIWLPYLILSKRVNATYRSRLPA